jgi:hypothetical protein
MQIVKIFLASSSELEAERTQFEIAINRRNNEWVKKGVYLELLIWEDFIDNMTKTGLQNEYNKAVAGCDIFVMLFSTKVGRYTAEEFENAFHAFEKNKSPRIYIYFIDKGIKVSEVNSKDAISSATFRKKINKLKHYINENNNFDEVRQKFLDQLEKLSDTDEPFIKLGKNTELSITDKILYIKLLRLTEMKDGAKPLYTRFIPRLDKSEDVFDEAQFFEVLVYSEDSQLIDVSNHSKGTVDMNILFPWKTLFFANPSDALVKQEVHQKITLSSNVYYSSTNFINGFQKGNTSYASRAYLYNKNLRVIIDFSCLNNHEKLQKSPPYAVHRIIKLEKESDHKKVEELQPGIFNYSASDIDEGDVVEIIFDIDWDVVNGE